jgi:hypothetical protein
MGENICEMLGIRIRTQMGNPYEPRGGQARGDQEERRGRDGEERREEEEEEEERRP